MKHGFRLVFSVKLPCARAGSVSTPVTEPHFRTGPDLCFAGLQSKKSCFKGPEESKVLFRFASRVAHYSVRRRTLAGCRTLAVRKCHG